MMFPQGAQDKPKPRKLFGFRSGTPWKSGVALVYYVAVLVYLVVAVVTPPPVPADARDALITKVSSLILFVWLISPAIFLSDTWFRSSLPLFRDRQATKSAIGMMIITLLLLNLFMLSENLHSPEYKAAFQAYMTRNLPPVPPEASALPPETPN